jgi:hypothetical protein
MAFNPFHAFRKHQKIFMAGLVLVAMVTFVLTGSSFRGGDAFSWITSLISRGNAASESFTVFGSKVTPRDLQLLQQERHIANTFMVLATNAAIQDRQAQIFKSLEAMKLPPDQKEQVLRAHLQRDSEINQLMDRVQTADPQAQFMARFMMQFNPAQSSYFGDVSEGDSDRPDRLNSLIDMAIWRHEADRLGIQLTDDDVNAEIVRLTNKRVTKEQFSQIEQSIRKTYKSMSPSMLLNALRDEFRVRLARAALEGYEPGARTQVPAPVTPDQFWNFYKENRTELQVAMLPVPVSSPGRSDAAAAGVIGLASQAVPAQPVVATTAALLAASAGEAAPVIKEPPTEADLQALFRKYAKVEPNPESDSPGFRQPRRIQLQWVSAKSDDPEYKKAAEAVLAATRVTMPMAYDLKLLADYEKARYQFRTVPWTDPSFVLAYYRKPENITAMVGQALGDLSTQGLAVLPPAVYQAAALFREDKETKPLLEAEMKKRIPVGATLILFGASPPATLAVLPPLSYAEKQPQYLPEALVQRELVQSVENAIADTLAASKLQNFLTNEVEERLKKPDARKDPNLPKELEEAAKKYNLQTGITAEPRTQYNIAQDESLQKLKSAMIGVAPMNRQADRQFAQGLFGRGSTKVYDVEHWPTNRFMQEAAKKPIDDETWRTAREPILFWKTKDEPAVTHTSLDKVRDQVAAAWYLQKARAQAQKEAERIAAAVPSTKGNLLQLRDFAAKEHLQMFELGPIAQLMQRRTATPMATGTEDYESYRLPEDRIRYDPQNGAFQKKFVDDLLSFRGQAPGTAKVLHDQPRDNYYVAVLVSSTPPPMGAFYLTYKFDAAGAPQVPNPFTGQTSQSLLTRFEEEQRQKYRKEFVDQLRVEAGINATNPSKEFRRDYDKGGRPGED